MHRLTACKALVAFAAAAVPLMASAQSPPPSQTAVATSQDVAEQRIRTLQTQLQITAAQTPLWNSFAAAMRENAASTDAMFRQRAAGASTMTALDNMRSYAQVARAYADNTEKLAAAFEALYAALSDQQRQAADALFRQQTAQNSAATSVSR